VENMQSLVDCGFISIKLEGFFLQNVRDSHNPDHLPGRSDGREFSATWPRSPRTFWCKNRIEKI